MTCDFVDDGTRSGNMNFAENVGLLKCEGSAPEDNTNNNLGALFKFLKLLSPAL
ncbi:MAG: hypothetical protein HRU77_03545 [Gammaproteobacteria bacterium]|nr:MAG: hypothetical protein HRU77_03545 [Gammaproteobacteria bacterium]